MRRTASALQGAGNAAVLEMKILANHGADPRFRFLRKGSEQRWAKEWNLLREGETVTLDGDMNASQLVNKLPPTLVDYGSSSDVEEEEDPTQAKKRRRLQLAKEWSRKRNSESQKQ
jgi:hypothetical protein